MRGIVSAMSVDPHTRVLAAGTFGRQVGLYDAVGQGECVGVFSVTGTEADLSIGGSGITQVSWSPCGRYLYIAERKSDGVVLYDIRKTGQLLGWLTGRAAQTNQRLAIDVVPTDSDSGHEIWAGGMDGYVRMWKNPHEKEAAIPPTYDFKAHNGTFPIAMQIDYALTLSKMLCPLRQSTGQEVLLLQLLGKGILPLATSSLFSISSIIL
jgi:WD40 repeat protein